MNELQKIELSELKDGNILTVTTKPSKAVHRFVIGSYIFRDGNFHGGNFGNSWTLDEMKKRHYKDYEQFRIT